MILPLLLTAGAGVAALLLLHRMFYPYVWDDVSYYLQLRRIGRRTQVRMKSGVLTFTECFTQRANVHPHRPFVMWGDQVVTYGEVEGRSNRLARLFGEHGGLGRGDVVAMLLSNEPDFICVWFGLAKLGCEVAFLNFNIKCQALLHCLQSCEAKALVVGADLLHLLDETLPSIQDRGIHVWLLDHSTSLRGVNTLLDKMDNVSAEPLPMQGHHPTDIMSNFLFIFTSGTTGLPKAARISHLKAVMCQCFLQLCGATAADVVYIPLPLYHMSASLLGIGGCIELGATCVLKTKFSASQFWKDCHAYNVTVFQYIGELCRYLINQPKKAEEANHNVRLAVGSGLRVDVWREFNKRFGSIRICESYGLTEASIGFLNYTNKVGPVGRGSYFNKLSLPFELLKYDPLTYEPVRTEEGRCLKVAKGETGILVSRIAAKSPFMGYAGNKVQSEKKLLRGVFKEGDVYFNTGDLMLQDHQDFIYFKDRIGDTFRWKGENVATTEVSEILGLLDFIQEINVYGVSVPGYEGRAGMAAVVLKSDQTLDGKAFYCHLVENLPLYSWPRFLRIQACLDTTATFKQKKGKLVEEGFCPVAVQDPLYFLDISEKDYVPLTEMVYESIISGKMRL